MVTQAVNQIVEKEKDCEKRIEEASLAAKNNLENTRTLAEEERGRMLCDADKESARIVKTAEDAAQEALADAKQLAQKMCEEIAKNADGYGKEAMDIVRKIVF